MASGGVLRMTRTGDILTLESFSRDETFLVSKYMSFVLVSITAWNFEVSFSHLVKLFLGQKNLIGAFSGFPTTLDLQT